MFSQAKFSKDSLIFFLGKKCGMTTIHDENLGSIPVTAIHIPDNYLIRSKNSEKDKYSSLVIGVSFLKEKSINKPQKEELNKNKSPSNLSFIKELRVPFDIVIDQDAEEARCFSASNFFSEVDFIKDNVFVDTTSVSQGKGFQGPMKRHNFKGLRASHGVSVSHRSHGSTGNRKSPSRVFKGKKMAGRMGNTSITTQSLKVVSFDSDNKIIFVKGAVSGAAGSSVVIKSAIKKSLPSFDSINGVKFLKG